MYEKCIEMSKNNDYITGNLLDFSNHQNYYKLIGIDLSRQANTSILEQILFAGNLEDDDATMFFVSEKHQIFRFITCDIII